MAKLKLVPKTEEAKDVTMLLRAQINARDWSQVHIEADRRKPVEIGDDRPWRYR